MAGPYGWQAKLAIGATSTVDKPLRFSGENFAANLLLVPDDEITGSRSAHIGQATFDVFTYVGSITLKPTAVEWSYILEWILGGSPSGTSYPLGNSIVAKYLSLDRATKVFLYGGVVVGKATISFVAGQKGTVTLDLFAMSETVNAAASHPVLTLDSTTRPFKLNHNVISVNSVTVCTTTITIVIDNLLVGDDFTNCTTGPADYTPGGPRDIRVSFTPAFDTTHAALYPPSIGGWATTITATNGATSLVFSLPAVVYEQHAPTVAAAGQKIRMNLSGKAYVASGSADNTELAVTLDSTP